MTVHWTLEFAEEQASVLAWMPCLIGVGGNAIMGNEVDEVEAINGKVFF